VVLKHIAKLNIIFEPSNKKAKKIKKILSIYERVL
jgi:hypothetical protein